MRYAVLVIFLMAGMSCASQTTNRNTSTNVYDEPNTISDGKQIEVTGTIWPSRAQAKFFIKSDDKRSSVHLRMDEETLKELSTGDRIFVKGRVECIHYPRPKDYYNDSGGTNYGVMLPQTFCYLNVIEMRKLPPNKSL